MDPTRDRLEVADVERPGVDVAVPADDVERVVVEDVGLEAVLDPQLDDVVAAVGVRPKLDRRVQVAVVVRGVLEQLAVLVAVAARDLDQARRREDDVTLLALGREAVGRALRELTCRPSPVA